MGKRYEYDRQLVIELVDREIEDGADIATEVARCVVIDLGELAGKGSLEAERSIRELARQALVQIAMQRLKANRHPVLIGHTGELVALPDRLPVPRSVRSNVDMEFKGRQSVLWTEMAWDVFVMVRTERFERVRQLDKIVAAMDEIIELRSQFPGTLTPGQACELAGIDPALFRLEEEAV